MNHNSTPMKDRALPTDTELRDQLQLMLDRAFRTQLWMLFLSSDHRILDPIMPMDDLPRSPDVLCNTEDFGKVAFSRVLVDRANAIRQMVGGESTVFVWERPGLARPTSKDLAWARAIAHEAVDQGLRVRAQFTLHSGGVRRIAEDLS
ncbi:hypothetical protein ACSHWG_13245 [Leucobacter sp. Z1108]|uniref:hypothetical protein n=1 Tax=Leucobacter sp. Z1108 TaxID=3439066 RepID=UPI003F37B830